MWAMIPILRVRSSGYSRFAIVSYLLVLFYMQQKATQNCVRFLMVKANSALPSTVILHYLLRCERLNLASQ